MQHTVGMKASVFVSPGHVEIRDVPDAVIELPTDAIVRVTRAAVCGSDLWFYRGINQNWKDGWRTGHEFVGTVEKVGSAVRSVRVGDAVIAPFAYSDGTCALCTAGLHTSCDQGGMFGGSEDGGGQAEAVRVPWADGTLVRMPDELAASDAGLDAAVLLSDVLPTGHHGCVRALVAGGRPAVIVGDGAVGLCAVLAAARLGADPVIAVGHHADRLRIAERFGATMTVDSRDTDAIERIRDATRGGAPSVVEAVGNQQSMSAAIQSASPGGTISFVGVPRQVEAVDLPTLFGNNLNLAGALAPARAHLEELAADVASGRIDPSPVIDMRVSLADVNEGYRAMDERRAIKVAVAV